VDFRNRRAERAVVFIHGFLGRADTTWGAFPHFLIEHPELGGWDVFGVGYSSSLRVDVVGMFGRNAGLELLGYYLRTTLAHEPFDGYRVLALIAHSMGGLIAQQALLDDRTRARVSHLFLFGTPSAGVRSAGLARALHSQARDMAESSPFIKGLRANWSAILSDPGHLNLRVIAAERDAFVPAHSSLGPFAEALRFVVPGTHISMIKPKDPKSLVVELVTAALLDRDAAGGAWALTAPTFLSAAVDERHDLAEAAVRRVVESHGGRLLDAQEDGFLAVFRRPERAAAAAVAAQRAIPVRVALHSGTAEEGDGKYAGAVVERAKRMRSLGHAGQILVSEVTAEFARQALPGEITLRHLGVHRLDDLSEPQSIYQVESDGLTAEFPPLRSVDAKPNNLPEQTTSFVGRDVELAEVGALVGAHRLVTLVGSGGVGKTRLALHAGAALLDTFADGVFIVEFAALSDGTLVYDAIAAGLGLEGRRGGTADVVVGHLRSRAVLLIFDNCEHLVSEVAAAAASILRTCPKVHVLATSRESLRATGEHRFRMPSLPGASAVAELDAATASSYGSIALFVDRARAADPHFALSDANARLVARICRRLDGIALAIELAAACVGTVTLDALADRLDRRLLALSGGDRTALPRQQTMRALVEWSYNLLAPQERRVFINLSVFAGGFTLDAARAVCFDGAVDEFDAFDALSALADRSLIVLENRMGATRYRLLETLREFGRERVAEAGGTDELSRRHADYFRTLIERADGAYWMNDRAYVDPVEELDNLRGALLWTLREGNDTATGAAIAAAAMRFWFFAGDEGRSWADLARARLDAGAAPAVAARLDLGCAQLDGFSADETLGAADRAVAYYRERDEPQRLVESLYYAAMTRVLYFPDERENADAQASEGLARTRELEAPRLLTLLLRAKAAAMDPSDVAGRIALFSEGMELARADGGNPRLMAVFLMQIGELYFASAQYGLAVRCALQSVEEAERAGFARMLAFTKSNLAHYAVLAGEDEIAKRHARDAVRIAVESHDAYALTVALHAVAAGEGIAGDGNLAARLFGFCNERWGKLHPPRQEGSCEEVAYRYVREHLSERFGAETVERTMHAAGRLTQDQVVAAIFG
jgi:predicted ATPase